MGACMSGMRAIAECPFSIKMLDEAPFDMIDSPLSSCRENRHVYALVDLRQE